MARWLLCAGAVLGLAGAACPQSAATSVIAPAGAPSPRSHAPQPGIILSDPSPVFDWKAKKLGKGQFVAAAVDSQDRAHVVYRRVGKVGALVHATRTGSKWSSEVIVQTSESSVVATALAVDADDDLHVAYSTFGTDLAGIPNPYPSLQYARRGADGWEAEYVEFGGAPSLAVDGDGTVHILAIKNTGADPGLRHVVKTPSGWDVEIVVPGSLGGGRTALLLHDGTPHVLFSDAAGDLSLATPHAGEWNVEPIDTGHAMSAAFGADGVLHVVYDGGPDAELRHAWKDELGWHQETLVSESVFFGSSSGGISFTGEWPAVAVDAAGRLQVVCGLRASTGAVFAEALVFSTLEDGAWSTPWLLGAPIGYQNAIAADSRGLLTVATLKAVSLTDKRVTAFSLRGSKLSLAVTPKGAGTVTVAPTGTACTTKSSEFVYPGTEVTLTAAAAPGFTFAGWTGGASGGDADVLLTMNQDEKVVAHFEPVP